jgi:D-glycero-alpha-D-manno-heptose-7-phosphate kinase
VFAASAPSRLDFGGGWTDVPPYPGERGGFVCNLAIERRARVTLQPGPAEANRLPLVAAAVRRAGYDGRITIASDFPIGAGLGGSSAAGVALAAALAAAQEQDTDPAGLAEWSRSLEVDELGIAGGRQDHYAAAFGGALGLTFGDGVSGDHVSVEQIPLSAAAHAALEARITLVYTGESRMSGDTITAVLDAYRDRSPRVVEALDRMAVLARDMRNALHAADVTTLAALVDEHWIHQRALHPRITTERIDALERAARAVGAQGLKALGASGGGCVMIVSDADDAPRVAEAVAPFGDVLPWRIAARGVEVSRLSLDA